MAIKIDYTGRKVGDLEILKDEGNLKWKCKCSCGSTVVRSSSYLRSDGKTKSCGCKKYTAFHGNTKVSPRAMIIKSFMNNYIQGAKRRKISWDLTLEQFSEIIFKACFYCGRPYDRKYSAIERIGQRKYFTKHTQSAVIYVNGVDRVDNTKGYIIDNVQPCCKICQRAKSDSTLQEFEEWIERLILFRTS